MKKFITQLFKGLGYFAIFATIQIFVGSIFYHNLNNINIAILASAISGIVFVLAICFSLKIRDKNVFKELRIVKIDTKFIIPIILFGMAFGYARDYICFEVIPFPESWHISYEESLQNYVDASPFLVFFATVLVAGIAEEICFRSLVYNRFKKGMPIALAAILSSVLFGVGHFSPIWFITSVTSALIMVFFYEKFNSVLPSIIIHMVNNFMAWLHTYYIFEDDNSSFTITRIAMIVMTIGYFFYFAKLPNRK